MKMKSIWMELPTYGSLVEDHTSIVYHDRGLCASTQTCGLYHLSLSYCDVPEFECFGSMYFLAIL